VTADSKLTDDEADRFGHNNRSWHLAETATSEWTTQSRVSNKPRPATWSPTFLKTPNLLCRWFWPSGRSLGPADQAQSPSGIGSPPCLAAPISLTQWRDDKAVSCRGGWWSFLHQVLFPNGDGRVAEADSLTATEDQFLGARHRVGFLRISPDRATSNRSHGG